MTTLNKIDLFLTFDEFLAADHAGTKTDEIYDNIIKLFNNGNTKNIFMKTIAVNLQTIFGSIDFKASYKRSKQIIVDSKEYYNKYFQQITGNMKDTFTDEIIGEMPNVFLCCIMCDMHCSCITVIREDFYDVSSDKSTYTEEQKE